MIIKKYELISKYPEEYEFEVTKYRKRTINEKRVEIVDSDGNIISPHNKTAFDQQMDIQEGLSAVSLPSRMPAEVKILETEEGPVVNVSDSEETENVLQSNEAKIIKNPNKEITWADK